MIGDCASALLQPTALGITAIIRACILSCYGAFCCVQASRYYPKFPDFEYAATFDGGTTWYMNTKYGTTTDAPVYVPAPGANVANDIVSNKWMNMQYQLKAIFLGGFESEPSLPASLANNSDPPPGGWDIYLQTACSATSGRKLLSIGICQVALCAWLNAPLPAYGYYLRNYEKLQKACQLETQESSRPNPEGYAELWWAKTTGLLTCAIVRNSCSNAKRGVQADLGIAVGCMASWPQTQLACGISRIQIPEV